MRVGKKAEHRRIDAFELWCWRRLLRVLWTARRSNQSILKEINPEYSLEGLMLKLKLQYFGHLMWRTDSFKKTLMLEEWGQEEKGTTEDLMVGWHNPLSGHEFEINSGSWWWTRNPGVLRFMGSQRVGLYWETEYLHEYKVLVCQVGSESWVGMDLKRVFGKYIVH